MKPHSKPPANHLQTAFRAVRPALFSLIFTLFSLHSPASVPLAWQVTPRNPAPVAFDRHHGETLELRCTFTGFGELPFDQAADIRLWYQTNGMATAWWSVPASVSSNVLSATFQPSADPGADRLSLFFGAPSNAYASAVLRLRHSPGFAPNILPPPDVTSWAEELAAIRVIIDYSTSNADLVTTIRATAPAPDFTTNNADLVATIEATAPAPGDYETVSNRAMGAIQTETDPTVPAWAKSPTPPASGLSANDVCDIVTNEVAANFSEWRLYCNGERVIFYGGIVYVGAEQFEYDGWVIMNERPDMGWGDPLYIDAPYTTLRLEWDSRVMLEPTDQTLHYVAERDGFPPFRNALGLARLADLPPLTNGLATEASVAAANTRASNAQNTANSVAGTVAAWETYWDGDEVRVTVTNYDSAVHLPSLYIEQKIEDTEDYRVVWDERTRWESNDVQMAEMRSAIDEKADRAWGFYDSHTGNYAPDGYTWLSSPKIAIAGGLAYQRTLTTDGAIWVLVSNGMVAQTSGDITNGFFRVKDDEGNTTFEIVRGNKRMVGATASGIKVTSPRNSPTVTIEIPYNVVSEISPTLYGTASLSSPEWTQLSPQWLGQSGAWTAVVTTASSQYFVKGEYEVGGETYIKNVAPISVESGIYCTDGVHKVRPVYNNGTITWEVVQ
jgi:hypothetical protein